MAQKDRFYSPPVVKDQQLRRLNPEPLRRSLHIPHRLQKRASFFSVCLCWSRACLRKMISVQMNIGARKGRFPYSVEHIEHLVGLQGLRVVLCRQRIVADLALKTPLAPSPAAAAAEGLHVRLARRRPPAAHRSNPLHHPARRHRDIELDDLQQQRRNPFPLKNFRMFVPSLSW